MPLQENYERIAERALDAAQHLSAASIQESMAFYTYHAFESIGAALISSSSRNIPRSHRGKLNQFMTIAQARTYRFAVAQLSIQLQNLRNRCLYPIMQPDGTAQQPEEVLTLAQAQRLLQRVRGIITRIRRDL